MLHKFRVLDVRNTNYEGIFFDGMWLQSSKHDLGLENEEEEEEKPVPGIQWLCVQEIPCLASNLYLGDGQSEIETRFSWNQFPGFPAKKSARVPQQLVHFTIHRLYIFEGSLAT